ncbi:MAG: autotransporter-associated beta strand repeat-containing protein [bacterium]|nr:autotransporter-associated beta strand repeat-containing protein [bacterium]
MKTFVLTLPLLASLSLALSSSATDVNYWWSGDGSTPGGSGSWDTSNPHFSTATNGPFNITWDNNSMASDRANFTLPAGLVTVQNNGINCRRLVVHGSGYIFQGGKITSDETGNRFVIYKYAMQAVTISNNFDLTVPGSANIRVRNEGVLTNPLVLAGAFTFTDGSGTKWFDLEGINANGSLIEFTGALQGTPGANVRLRCGDNNANRANPRSIYNLRGASSHNAGTHVVIGTVNVFNPAALGIGLVQLATSTTVAGDPVRMFLYGDFDIDNSIFTATAKDSGIVTATFGKADADESSSRVNGTINLNSDTTLFNVHVGHSNAFLTFTSLVTDSTGVRGLLKTGAGTFILTGPNIYEGTTEVNAGTLLANSTGGSATGAGNVLVRNGATLGGTGRIGGSATIQNGASLAPGQSVGTIRINQLTLDAGSSVRWEKDAGVDVTDKAIVTNLTIAGTCTIKVIPLPGAEPDGEFVTNTIFQVVNFMDGFTNLVLDLSQTPGWDGDIVLMQDGLSIGVVLTPEPASCALLSVLALALFRSPRMRS